MFRSAFPIVSLLALASCSNQLLQKPVKDDLFTDDRVTLKGRACTAPPDPSGFPVKVVLIVDQSGSMCVSDPPGAQAATAFCQFLPAGVTPPGVTTPARVRALRSLLGSFAGRTNVQVALVPFETNIRDRWPEQGGFGNPSDPELLGRVDNLQRQLGKGTDYQGALATAYATVAADIAKVNETDPASLPRTRYVVVFLTDGTPYPRCAGNDPVNGDLTGYATPDQPDLIWPDSSGTGDYCNTIDPDDPDAITGFVKGSDRNQNYQLFSYVDQLMELKKAYNIGDLRMHTVLLFNEAAVQICGLMCQDIYGTYAGVAAPQFPAAAKKIASFVLRGMARRGNGVYQEFNNGDIQSLGLGALDYSDLSSRNVLKTLMVETLSSWPGAVDRVVDTDGDGLPDDVDQQFKYKTSQFASDSDEDGFLDYFEVLHKEDGFNPAQKDTRGCDRDSPLTLDCAYTEDSDGDGLTTWAERYVKSKTGLVDSDADGVPDGIEVKYGLSAIDKAPAGLDTDGDGIPDLQEYRLGSNPVRQDKAFQDKNGHLYEITSEVQSDDRVCYDFSVSNVQLVTPPKQAGVGQGYNLFKVWFGEAPESGVATDYGVWRTACAWAQYDPPIREPAGSEITFQNSNFTTPSEMNSEPDYQRNCRGRRP
jgi:Bacterial TSP3 repeat